MSIRRLATGLVLLSILSLFSAFSQSQQKKDFITWLDDAGDKLVQLAEAVPQEKYGWAPSKEVRTFSEVCMHVASTNYFFPTLVGVSSETKIDDKMQKETTDKKIIIPILKASFAHIHKAIMDTPDENMDKMVKMFGNDATIRSVFLLAITHDHEHLGQAIAYARMNGVTPPWSRGN